MFFSQEEQLRALGERVERSDWDVKLSQIRQASGQVSLWMFFFCTLMKPENQNHLFEKENHLKRTFIFGVPC